ncbi:MAG TPA: Bax inhibitor-1/YccA family protein, partial [Saprospiraceae bacterium]|nr:Bax inhibitor-1/YccA family protein [Saprospiraceae bacterium]
VGYYTKQDLTKFGQIMFFGLIGIIIASIVNFFMQNEMMYWIISYVGVAVFVGLIAYDTQKIKAYALMESEEMRRKGAILGALALYLDFINLFIYLLRLFGSRR